MVYNGNPRPVLLLVTHLGSEVTGHMGIAWCDYDDTFRLSCQHVYHWCQAGPFAPHDYRNHVIIRDTTFWQTGWWKPGMGLFLLGICKTNPTAIGNWSCFRWIFIRFNIWWHNYRRDHSQSLDRVGCRREFTAFELLRQFHGCIHVFCHPDRGADYPRITCLRHG